MAIKCSDLNEVTYSALKQFCHDNKIEVIDIAVTDNELKEHQCEIVQCTE